MDFEKIVNKLKMNKKIKAVALYGSKAIGLADNNSDTDMLCICSKFLNRNERKLLIKRLGATEKVDNESFGCIAVFIDDEEITLFFKELDELKKKTELFLLKKNQWFESDINTFIIKSKPLYDPSKIFKKWKQKAGRYPKWLKRLNLKQITYTGFFDMLKAEVIRKNWMWIDKILEDRLVWIIHAVYALNNKYYDTYKWVDKESESFKTKPVNFFKKIKEIHETDAKTDLIRKITLISNLIEETYGLFRKEYPKLKFVYDYKQRKEKIKEIKKLLEDGKKYGQL